MLTRACLPGAARVHRVTQQRTRFAPVFPASTERLHPHRLEPADDGRLGSGITWPRRDQPVPYGESGPRVPGDARAVRNSAAAAVRALGPEGQTRVVGLGHGRARRRGVDTAPTPGTEAGDADCTDPGVGRPGRCTRHLFSAAIPFWLSLQKPPDAVNSVSIGGDAGTEVNPQLPAASPAPPRPRLFPSPTGSPAASRDPPTHVIHMASASLSTGTVTSCGRRLPPRGTAVVARRRPERCPTKSRSSAVEKGDRHLNLAGLGDAGREFGSLTRA